jgi:replication factor C small subunit
MVLPTGNRECFDGYIEVGDIPHLLFHGPPGSGKTTLAQIIIECIPSQDLTLNASSEDRGIGTVKGKVKNFAASQPVEGLLKIVFLDEADAMTPDAQRALRNMMETYSGSCRFILTANYIDRIIPAIRSRCTCYEFSSFPQRSLFRHLSDILKKEKVRFTSNDLQTLIDSFYPDVRSIVNNMQSASMGGALDLKLLSKAALDPEALLNLMGGGEVRKLREFWAGTVDFTWHYRLLFNDFVLSMKDRQSAAVEVIAEYMYRDATVADREINFTACCVALMVLNGTKLQFGA